MRRDPAPLRFYAHQHISEDDIAAVVGVLRSDWLTQGPKVQEFEEALAAYVVAKFAVAVSSGTAALELAYRATTARAVVTSPLTFMATANAAVVAGAGVGFVDVDQATGNIDPHPGLTPPIGSVFVPVHFAGRAAPISQLTGFGGAVPVIEDACHALGGLDFDGCSRIGSCAHSLATVFSFHPVKSITTGEGGAVTTNDESLARELRSLRDHGREGGLMVRLGTNARMTDIQAALGLSQLKRCDEMLERRAELVSVYGARMEAGGFGADSPVLVPPLYLPEQFDANAFHLYPVRIKNGKRDEVKAKLNAQGIGGQKHYDPIVPLHPYYRERFGYKVGDFPNAEAWSAETLSLPLHAGMSEADVETVVAALMEALA